MKKARRKEAKIEAKEASKKAAIEREKQAKVEAAKSRIIGRPNLRQAMIMAAIAGINLPSTPLPSRPRVPKPQ